MKPLLALTLLAAVAIQAADDLVLADFNGDTYGAWEVTGEAFGPGPARGTLAGQMPVSGFKGQGLVNSFFRGDGTTGTLTSPEFKIERRYLSFLIGGGYDPEKLALTLVVDGQVVRTATGPNQVAGGTEALEPMAWDLSDLAGKTARIRIIDQATGGWGHLNVDELVLTDRKPALVLTDVKHQVRAERRYLHLPVKNGAPKRRMKVVVDGRTEREFEVELAEGEADFHTFLDLEPFRGKTLTLGVDRLPDTSRVLQDLRQSDEVPGAAELYREKLRPQFHFSSRRGWLNDPNGLVYHAGEYHLFYQHNPYGWDWGNMHWGHAVSKDLVHWRELPIALYPRSFGDWAFSGSAVVDAANTSGFKTGAEDVLVAAYTSTGRGECIVYSNDRGRTWKEYEGNPVVKHQGRDPRLLWHAPTRQWVMAVYHEEGSGPNQRQSIDFHTSPDLKRWTYQSRVDGYFECPDLFELPVDGKDGDRKWVLLGANGDYAIGRFDGRAFHPEAGKHRGHWGNAFYASQTFSNIPEKDGRRIQIGWGQVRLPGMPFNQMMTFPCELILRSTADGIRMAYQPVREIRKLYGPSVRLSRGTVEEGRHGFRVPEGDLFDLEVILAPGQAREVGLTLRGVPVTYDTARRELTVGDRKAPVRLKDGRLHLRLLADRASLELFAEDGVVYMPMAVQYQEKAPTFELFARGGAARLISARVTALKSAWRKTQD